MSSKIYDTKKSKEELDKAKEKTKNLIDKIPKIGKIKKEIAKGAVDYTIDKAEHVWENTGMKKKQDDTDTWVDEFLNGGPKLPENQPKPTSNAEPTPNKELAILKEQVKIYFNRSRYSISRKDKKWIL